MTIVSDASPINYLVLIGAADVLPALYGQVLIPEAVRRELSHPRGPETVRSWIETSPSWLSVREVRSTTKKLLRRSEDPFQRLD